MRSIVDRPRWVAASCVALAALLAGCGASPGGSGDDNAKKADEARESSKVVDVSKAGDVTLTVWDQEVRGGQAKQIKQLNEAFQAKYPNVTIKRVAKSFDDLNTTLKLAVSGNKNVPDVVQANQGRQIMGQLVKGGLLRPLDAYADNYKWGDRYSPTLLDLNRFSDDGKEFGEGSLYGVSQMGEIVGVYYNKDKVSSPPATFAEFEDQLKQAKSDGDVPISFGNLDPFAGIHEFQTVQNQYADKQAVRDFVFAKDGASFDTPENQEAATKLQDWAKAGYFTPDFNGTGYDPAWQQFAKGKGPFLIAGTWLTADLADNMGDKVGLHAHAPGRGGRRPGLARRREPAVRGHRQVREPRRGGRLHRLPHQRGGRAGARGHEQPAGDEDRRGALRRRVGRRRQGVEDAQRGRRLRAVHRLRHADVLRRHLGRRAEAAGREAGSQRLHVEPREGLHEVHGVALVGGR